MKFNKSILLLFLFTLIIIFLVNVLLTISHEQAHLEINKSFDCKNNYIEYNYLFSNAVTHALCNLNNIEEIEYTKLHMYNEIFSYNIRILIYSIILSAFLVSFTLLLLNK
jgi:ABC-type spermidine/putrescine transport system permease subunit I